MRLAAFVKEKAPGDGQFMRLSFEVDAYQPGVVPDN
jgi:hypothetical protein